MPLKSKDANRIWKTPNRKAVLLNGKPPLVLHLPSLSRIDTPAAKTLIGRICEEWGSYPRFKYHRIMVPDDLSCLVVQRDDNEWRKILIWDALRPGPPEEIQLPKSFLTLELAQNSQQGVRLLASTNGVTSYRRAYLINSGGNIVAETDMPGFAIADETMETVIFHPAPMPIMVILKPGKELELKIWHPLTGKEEIRKISVTKALKELSKP